MSTFGGSGWPAATQAQSTSVFGGGAFASASKPSSFSPTPFGSKSTTPGIQANGNGAMPNPFSAMSGGTASSPQPNPFATTSTTATTAPAVKNPFQTTTSQTPSPSIFSAKNTGTFGATSQPQANRSPSPFSMPSNQGRPNAALNAQANPFAPSTTKLNSGAKPTFGSTQFGSRKPFGAASDPEQLEPGGDSKRSKRNKGDWSDGEKRNGVGRGTTPDGPARNSRGAQEAPKNGHGPIKGALANGPSGHGKKVHFEQAPKGPSRTTKHQPHSSQGFNRQQQRPPPPSALKTNNKRPAHVHEKSSDDYANEMFAQLERDGIHPPAWPANPGMPSSKNAMMQFREDYKEYREKARASLIRAGLIDDPEDRKRLEDAIPFKGICEDMCPEFEKITRITEFDVKQAEKDPATSYADITKMVKKLARSAAGQEAPLPMDVRSIAALRRTLDYLIDDLLEFDDNLPVLHGFLWDRTRAIRRDFAFFSSMNDKEMRDQVYCLETIARFHVTSLHLLAQEGYTPEDFSEQQEVEQLGKTLISLMYAYSDCEAEGITCENEAEFRAYQLIFRAFHPDILENVQREWDPKFWRESDEVRTAVSLVEALQNTQDFHGPLKGAPSFAASSAYNSFFRIVEDPSVSYTMACFAEIHFGQLRRSILAAVKKAFSRPKQTPKDITAAVLNSYLRFDTVKEAVEFAKLHGLDFAPDVNNPNDLNKSYLILEYGKGLEYPRLHHTYSANIVEKKRGTHSLPEVIHQTVSEDASSKPQAGVRATDEDSLFVGPSSPEGPRLQAQFPPAPAPIKFPSPFAAAAQAAPANGQIEAAALVTKPATATPFAPAVLPKTQALAGGLGGVPATAPSPGLTTSQPFPFARPGLKPSTGPSLTWASSQTQTTTSPAQQTTGPTPAPTFTFKPTTDSKLAQPATAPTLGATGTATPTPSVLSGGNKPSTSPFNFLTSAPSKPAETTPTIKITPPTPAFPAPQPSPAIPATGATPAAAFKPPSAPSLSTSTNVPPKIPQAPTITKPATATQVSPPSQPSPFVATTQPQAAITPAPPTKEEKWTHFTKWFVSGDNGLMDEFERYAVEEAVKKAFDQFVREEKERIRKEEDEKSWADARKFRTYSLGVKYFYRWRETARQNRASALRRSDREQMRAYRESKRVEKLKQKKEAERAQRRLALEAAELDNVEDLKTLLRKRSLSTREDAEEALLASGVLSGVRNERDAAARIVGRRSSLPAPLSPVRKSSMPDFMHKIKTGIAESVNRSIGKVVRPRTSSSAASVSSVGGGGAKTRALREEFSGSALRKTIARSRSRYSLPPSEDGSTTSLSRVSSRWRLKAMGLVTMPDGSALPEYLADQIKHEGKRFPELGNFGMPPPETPGTSYADAEAEVRPATMDGTTVPRPRDFRSLGSHKPHASVSGVNGVEGLGQALKRKRTAGEARDEGGNEDEEGGEQEKNKRILLDTQKTIREMRRLREEMEEGTGWFKEQNERLQSEMSSRPGTPWGH